MPPARMSHSNLSTSDCILYIFSSDSAENPHRLFIYYLYSLFIYRDTCCMQQLTNNFLLPLRLLLLLLLKLTHLSISLNYSHKFFSLTLCEIAVGFQCKYTLTSPEYDKTQTLSVAQDYPNYTISLDNRTI